MFRLALPVSGQALTGGYKTVNKTRYYFMENGRAACDAFASIGGKLYYFDGSYAQTSGGWFCTGDGYYYAGSDGSLLTDTVKEGYVLDSSGKSTTKYRIV